MEVEERDGFRRIARRQATVRELGVGKVSVILIGFWQLELSSDHRPTTLHVHELTGSVL